MLDEADDIHPLFAGEPTVTEPRKRIARQTREAIRQYGVIKRGARLLGGGPPGAPGQHLVWRRSHDLKAFFTSSGRPSVLLLLRIATVFVGSIVRGQTDPPSAARSWADRRHLFTTLNFESEVLQYRQSAETFLHVLKPDKALLIHGTLR